MTTAIREQSTKRQPRQHIDEQIMVIRSAPAELVLHLTSRIGSGRFGPHLIMLKKALEQCPTDKIKTVDPTAEMLGDKKERIAYLQSANKMLDNHKIPWRGRWSMAEKVFFFMRKEKQK